MQKIVKNSTNNIKQEVSLNNYKEKEFVSYTYSFK